MTSTARPFVRSLVAVAAVTGLALVAAGCGSDEPKATPASNPTTTAAPAVEPVDSPYCLTARKWLVHEFDGEGDAFIDDPPALRKYWGEWMDFIATATRQAPAEVRDDWAVSHVFVVEKFTPLLEKYGYDIARLKAEGTPAELAIAQRLDQDPPPAVQRAQEAEHEYEGRVCQTGQPPAAEVSFDGVTPNQAYCDNAEVGYEAVEEIAAKKWSVDAVRSFATSDEFQTGLDAAAANAPAEIEADVLADVDWQRNEQADVLEKYGYDVRKLFLDGSPDDRAAFQRSDPAIADHYARTVAYEEQVCGF